MKRSARIRRYVLPVFYPLLLLVLLPGSTISAQDEQAAGLDTTASTLNKRDQQNRKQGTWFIRKEALRGEPAYVTFGDYLDDKKQGAWYRLDAEGQLESVLNYRA